MFCGRAATSQSGRPIDGLINSYLSERQPKGSSGSSWRGNERGGALNRKNSKKISSENFPSEWISESTINGSSTSWKVDVNQFWYNPTGPRYHRGTFALLPFPLIRIASEGPTPRLCQTSFRCWSVASNWFSLSSPRAYISLNDCSAGSLSAAERLANDLRHSDSVSTIRAMPPKKMPSIIHIASAIKANSMLAPPFAPTDLPNTAVTNPIATQNRNVPWNGERLDKKLLNPDISSRPSVVMPAALVDLTVKAPRPVHSSLPIWVSAGGFCSIYLGTVAVSSYFINDNSRRRGSLTQ